MKQAVSAALSESSPQPECFSYLKLAWLKKKALSGFCGPDRLGFLDLTACAVVGQLGHGDISPAHSHSSLFPSRTSPDNEAQCGSLLSLFFFFSLSLMDRPCSYLPWSAERKPLFCCGPQGATVGPLWDGVQGGRRTPLKVNQERLIWRMGQTEICGLCVYRS